MASTTFKLNTGASIPAVGLGTWQGEPGQVKTAVSHALDVGYRHIDCAYMYDNEEEVGAGLKEAFASGKVKREDVFITTKLWCTFHSRVEQNLDMSLKDLGVDYVDLYLMHWPVPMNPHGNHPKIPKLPDGSRDLQKDWSHTQTWKELEKVLSTGKVKAIGVCNYSKRYLEELLRTATVVPAVNQIENHPLLPQQEIVDFCHAKGIHITAYSPLGSTGSPLMSDPRVVKIAERKRVSPGNILLSYHIARGSSVLAKSVTPTRIEANLNVVVELDQTDMQSLDAISEDGVKRFVYPNFGVDFGFPDKQ